MYKSDSLWSVISVAPAPVKEELPPPEKECRFKLVEPPPSEIKIAPLNLVEHNDIDELLEAPPPIQYKYKERLNKFSDEGKIHFLSVDHY